MSMSEATVLTSENSAEFYANKLGLADQPEVEAVATEPTEPTEEIEQSEPEAENEDKVTEERKSNPKLEKRFSDLTKQREQLRKEVEQERLAKTELENRLKAYEAQAAPKQEQSSNQRPQPSQFVDAFEYAEALADWSAENAVMRARQEDVERRRQEDRNQVIDTWNKRLETTKAEIPDFEDMVQSSDVIVPDAVRDAILESEVGPRILYHLAENKDIAEKITKSSIITALREIGKLEAKFEKSEEPTSKTVAVKSKAPTPISPIKGSGTIADVQVDGEGKFYGSYQAYKEARKAGRIR